MDEPVDGILHWTTYHEGIGQPVHSHLHVASGAIFDPRLPEGGLEALADAATPRAVLLSNRHHLRHAPEIVRAFDCPVYCHEAGLHEFEGKAIDVQGFAFGDEVVPGVTALELGVLTPEDTIFRIDAGPGALLFADGLIRSDGELSYVPDFLMGDDPGAIRDGLTSRLREIAAEQEYDALLFAHGSPLAPGGRDALRAFAGV